jgi:RNA methyltransferase, TrmH family
VSLPRAAMLQGIHDIDSLANQRVKGARALREKKHRRGSGRFLAEGLRICTEAREQGVLPLELFLTRDGLLHPLTQTLAEATQAAGGEVFRTNEAVLAKLSGKDNPQAVVAVYAEHPTPLASLDRTAAPIWLVAQAMRDPGNLGTLLRTGDAVGAGGVILIDDCVDPFSVETVRASMGAIFTQAIVQTQWDAFLPWLRSGPGLLVATSLAAGTVDYRVPEYPAPTFILIGNEARGLPEAYEAAADVRVQMPMRGKADSLNAAVAAAVMAYAVLDRQERGRA